MSHRNKLLLGIAAKHYTACNWRKRRMDNYSWTDKHMKEKQKAISKYEFKCKCLWTSSASFVHRSSRLLLHLLYFPSRYFYISTSIPRSHPNFCNRGNFVIYKFLKTPIEKELLTFSPEYFRSGYLPSNNCSAHVHLTMQSKKSCKDFFFIKFLCPQFLLVDL